ncbi:MAG TPA: response regulator [Chthoniobacteraceae bacterium]|nr:response regulator [Chthoniobacteraceae bacterium]
MNKTHILIVEDEGIVAKDLQALLKRLGYHVPATVGTGELAIQAAIQNQPDLILMDIQLRGSMDGVQASAAITSQQDVPIVYLTANSDEATLQRAKGTAPFGFLVKPFEERAIQAGIEMALYKHRTDKKMREREQWLSTTLTSIADAVITTDADGKITFLNTAAETLSGWSLGDAVGLPYAEVFQIVEESTRLVPTDRVAKALTAGATGSFSNHTILVRRDTSEVHIEHSVAPIRQGLQELIGGCVIVFNDVSERKQLEERLLQVQKMDAIGKLAGGIAHDFNNAITAIVGYAEMILLKIKETDPLHSDARQIVRAAEHSARLTHQLLAFSRKQVLQPRSLSLNAEIAGVEDMVRRLIGENIRLEISAAPDLWRTMADAGQIQQVVINLAINARDAMPEGGCLKLQVSNTTVDAVQALRISDGRPGEFVLLTVSDNGTGMTRETMQRVFEPFFTTKGPGKGSGIGLATCYGIIRQTSGMISVASEIGSGTTFSIYLPKAITTEQAVTCSQDDAELPQGTETILLVEDEEILRELGVEVLGSLGYRMLVASDGTEAVRILSSEAGSDIDLVVTDLVMPRMSGRELVTWMGERFGAMPVLFMSGYTDDEIIRNAVEGAEIEYLQKPFTPKALAHKIREVLDRSSGLQRSAFGRDSDEGRLRSQPAVFVAHEH